MWKGRNRTESLLSILRTTSIIYTNPISDFINIDKGSNTSLEITVLNSDGAIAHLSNSKDQISIINMAKMASGIYIVTLKNEWGVEGNKSDE